VVAGFCASIYCNKGESFSAVVERERHPALIVAFLSHNLKLQEHGNKPLSLRLSLTAALALSPLPLRSRSNTTQDHFLLQHSSWQSSFALRSSARPLRSPAGRLEPFHCSTTIKTIDSRISDIPTYNLWAWVLLVSSGMPPIKSSPFHPLTSIQLRKGSAHRTSRGRQEDYEALQHSRIGKEDLSRIEASEAPTPRKCS